MRVFTTGVFEKSASQERAETQTLLSRVFTVTSVDRIYPDEIESAYGTKQLYFEAQRPR